MKDAKELLALVWAAHGGLDTWKQWASIKAHVSMGGVTWGIKGHDGVMADLTFTGSLHEPIDSWSPIFETGIHSWFNGKDVELIGEDGQVIERLENARQSFEGFSLMTPWSRLQLAYFCSYATWNYVTTPFLLSTPGFQLTELEPWEESDERWRRLEAIFPDGLATHSKRQVFYFSPDGFLKRHDYWPEVLGNSSATHYFDQYQQIQGIHMPTSHKIYPLDDKTNLPVYDPLLVSIELRNIRFYRDLPGELMRRP